MMPSRCKLFSSIKDELAKLKMEVDLMEQKVAANKMMVSRSNPNLTRLDSAEDGLGSPSVTRRRLFVASEQSRSLKSKIPRYSLPQRPKSSTGVFTLTEQKVCTSSTKQAPRLENRFCPQSNLPRLSGKWKGGRTMHSSFSSVSSVEHGSNNTAMNHENCNHQLLNNRNSMGSPSSIGGQNVVNMAKMPESKSPFVSSGCSPIPRCSSAMGLSVGSSTNNSAVSQTIQTTRSGPSYTTFDMARVSPVPMYARKRNTKGLSSKMKKSFAEFDVGRL